MSPFVVVAVISVSVLASLFLNVVTNAINAPRWATPVHVWLLLGLIVCADIALTYLQQSHPVTAASSAGSNAVPPGGLQRVDAFDPQQASRTILAITGYNSGNAHLAEIRLDGAVSKNVGPGPVGGPFTIDAVPGEAVVSGATDGKSGAMGLMVETFSGTPVRVLTGPPAGMWDTGPTVTASGEVYFVRTRLSAANKSGGAVIMRVPLDGRGPAVQEPLPMPIQPSGSEVSANATGTLIADQCLPDGLDGPNDVCVNEMPGGSQKYAVHVPSGDPVSYIALSPDGRYVAYTQGAVTPYGDDEVYVTDTVTGSTVMVSQLPGTNGETSWINGSARPCLLFSNSQTSGDTVYVSCLESGGGTATARVGAGDYPVWLGGTMTAPAPRGPSINWTGIWRRSRSSVLLALVAVLGVLLGMFASWLPDQDWLKGKSIVAALAALTLVLVGGTVVLPDLATQAVGGPSTIAALDPAQADGILLAASAYSPGNDQELAVRLNGTNVQPLTFYPATSFVPADTAATSFIDSSGMDAPGSYIQLVDATGNAIRKLSNPPPGDTDQDPVLAAQQGEVYFLRSTISPIGDKTSEVSQPIIMRVPLAGGAARPVPLPVKAHGDQLSVNAAGTQLAWGCGSGLCIGDPGNGTARRVATEGGGVNDIALSADGTYLAYTSPGGVYAVSLASGRTTLLAGVAALPGFDVHPSWVTGAAKTCLLFGNEQTPATMVYLACLTPKPAWAPVTPGNDPIWLGP